MEKVLMREEAKELLGLLGLPHTCWGNVPLMKKKLAEARRKYHPDKGGDNETMARLNDLWAKAAANLEQVHASDPGFFAGPVSFFWDCDFPTLGEMMGPLWKGKLLQTSHCWIFGLRGCGCITCTLYRKHKKRAKAERRPLTWGSCYCFNCYLVWFGLHRSLTAHFWWSCVLYNSTMDELGLWGEITLY
ncbi:TPA_asm: Small T antigen [Steenbok polyomavirus]|nr:TPA_asm: Small T antigen [Steenbok polyomavirus]